MTFQEFETVINQLEGILERSHTLGKSNVSLIDYDEAFYVVINTLLESQFGKEGKDWIDWFLYERKSHSGAVLTAHDKNNNEICHNLLSLWEVVTGE